MDRFTEGVHDLHERVARLDELLTTQVRADDFRERRVEAAADVAEGTRVRLRNLYIAGALIALLWTPGTAYGAVWVHERIRNHCYPGVLHSIMPPPSHQPWYCDLFPGTGRAPNLDPPRE